MADLSKIPTEQLQQMLAEREAVEAPQRTRAEIAAEFRHPTDQGPAFRAFAERNPIASRAAAFLSGLPFIGQGVDEALGAVGGAIGPNDSATATQAIRSMIESVPEGQRTALQIGGGLTGAGLGLAAAGPAVVAAAPQTVIGQTATAIPAGAALGAAEGASQGFLSGETPAERAQNLRQQAVVGGLLGGAIGGATPVVTDVVRRAALPGVRRVQQSRAARDVARRLGLSPVTREAIAREAPLEAVETLRRAGDDAMIADITPGLANMVVQAQGPTGRAMRAIQQRANIAGQRLGATMDDILGPVQGPRQVARNIAQRTAPARQQAYDLAYSRAIDYADETGLAIEGVLDRIPKRAIRKAVREANEAMQAEGIRNQQIFVTIAEDGTATFREAPNVQQLDFLKRGLNAVGEGIDDLGRPTAEARRAQMLARDLRDAIGDAVPEYLDAVQLGGDKIAEDNALRLGNRLLRGRTTREEVAELAADLTQAEQTALRQGLRSEIDDTLANVTRALNDGEMEAREAAKLVRNLSSRANRDKLTIALGDDAGRLLDEVDRAAQAIDTRANVQRGSATQPRQATAQAIEQFNDPGVLGSAAQGEAGQTIRRMIQGITGQTPVARQQASDAVMSEIADTITGLRGQEAVDATRALLELAETDPIAQALARRIGLTAGGSLAASPAALQGPARTP